MLARLLVVDDNPLELLCLCKCFKEGLGDTGVEGASCPERALLLLRTIEFDVVISDVRMPRLNGLEFMRRVKARRPETVVYLMTGCEPKVAGEALRQGAAGFLSKPLVMIQFLPILRASLETAARRRLGERERRPA